MGHHPLSSRSLLTISVCFFWVFALAPATLRAAGPGPAGDKSGSSSPAETTEEAYELLWQAVFADPADQALNLKLARAAMQRGLYENAAAAYERILMTDPGRVRVRFELARAYYLLKSYTLAEEELRTVLADGPEPLKEAARKYLAAIAERRSPHRLDVSASLGLLYDTNANAGPEDSIIETSFGPTAANPGSAPVSDWGVVLGLQYDHRWDFGREGGYGWRNTLGFHDTFYLEHHELNLLVTSLASGPTYRRESFRLGLPCLVDIIAYGSSPYGQFYGVRPNLTWQAAPALAVDGEAVLQGRAYSNDDDRDGSYAALRLTPRYFLNDNRLMLQGRLGYAWENAKSSFKANEGWEGSVAVYADLATWCQVFGQLGFQQADFDAPDPHYGKTQEDEQYRAMANVVTPLPWWRTKAVLSFIYTRNRSNINIYDYDRKQTTLMLTKRF